MKTILVLFFISLFIIGCKEETSKNNSKELNKNLDLNLQFNNEQADTLLAIEVSELSNNYLVLEVLQYTTVEIDSNKFFYAIIRLDETPGLGIHEKEVIIKYFDKNTSTTPYLTSFTNKGTKFTCDLSGSNCLKCNFETDGVNNPGKVMCNCKDDQANNNDCSLLVETNKNLWEPVKFADGMDILSNITVADFSETSYEWPF